MAQELTGILSSWREFLEHTVIGSGIEKGLTFADVATSTIARLARWKLWHIPMPDSVCTTRRFTPELRRYMSSIEERKFDCVLARE